MEKSDPTADERHGLSNTSAAPNAKPIYRFRAECLDDVYKLLQRLGGVIYRVTIDHGRPCPDVEMEIEIHLSLEELRGLMRQVPEGHVMEQTVASRDAYTGECDYSPDAELRSPRGYRQYAFRVGMQYLGSFDAPDVFIAFYFLCEEMAKKEYSHTEWREFATGNQRLEATGLGAGLHWSMFRAGWIAELNNRYSKLEAQAIGILER